MARSPPGMVEPMVLALEIHNELVYREKVSRASTRFSANPQEPSWRACMKLEPFITQDSYRTPERPPSWLAARNPTAVFYAKVLLVVVKASRLACKGLYTDARWILSSIETIKALESVGVRFEIRNAAAHRQLESACVFVGNHMSVLETFVLPCLIQPHRDITFVVKESLIDYPLFKHVMRSRRPIVVGRANPRQDLRTVMEEGQQRLKKNVSVIIFPQTTRSVEFDPDNFNSLGVKLAIRSKVPVVPIALKTDAWGLGRRFKDFGRIQPLKTVRICFGDPMQVQGSGKKEHRIIIDFILDNFKRWQREDSKSAR